MIERAAERAVPVRLPLERHAQTRRALMALATSGRGTSGSFIAVELLCLAYQRPCCICERTGWCQHREPDVELALLGARVERGGTDDRAARLV